MELIGEVEPMEGARQLLEEIKRRGHSVVLASSAKADEVEHYLELLDARMIADAWTTSADVEETKPQPDLVNSALQNCTCRRLRTRSWSATQPGTCTRRKRPRCRRSRCAPVASARTSLSKAGAAAVFESVAELLQRLDETKLA